MNNIFSKFPKTRAHLPPEYIHIYEDEYFSNRVSGGIGNKTARFLEGWMHSRVRKESRKSNERLLELGAGSLNHVPWENNYATYDVVEPFEKLFQSSPFLSKVDHIYNDISQISADSRYDRIFSIAVLEHLLDLPSIIAASGLLLSQEGVFCAGIPSEGGWLWRQAWQYGTGPGFTRRTALPYEPIMIHEHVNTAFEIEACIRYFFKKMDVRRFPTPLFDASIYCHFSATMPVLSRCQQYLHGRKFVNDQCQ